MSSFEDRLLSCHFPRTSEIRAGKETTYHALTILTEKEVLYIKVKKLIAYIHQESFLKSFHIFPQSKIISELKAISSQNSSSELHYMISCGNKVHVSGENKGYSPEN